MREINSPPRPATVRILMIDDDDTSVAIVEHLLARSQRMHYKVDWCVDAQRVQEKLAGGDYDVCLLDYYLGNFDGIEILKQLRAAGNDVPIIMYTGQNDIEIEQKAARHGADDYLSKDDLSAPLLERMIFYAMERRQNQAELIRLAKSDPLTGAANRTALYEYLNQVLVRAKRHGREFAVLVIDLDRFKQLNDGFGHAYGDSVLVGVVETLVQSVRGSDLVARVGGDEFVVVLDDVEASTGAAPMAEKIMKLLSKGFAIDKHQVVVHASVGVAIWPHDAMTPDELLAKADAAMYEHKNQDRDVAI